MVREGIEAATKQEAKSMARRALVKKVAQSVGHAVSWTIRTANKTIRVIGSPIQKTAAAWRKLPPATRRTVVRVVAATMFFVAVTARTLPKLPEAVNETLRRMGKDVGTLVNETVKGMGDAFVETIMASLGLHESSVRPFRLLLGGLFLVVAIILLCRHSKHASLPPARLA